MTFAGMEILIDLPRATQPRQRGQVRAAMIELPDPGTASERAVRDRWMMGVKMQSWPLGVERDDSVVLCGTNDVPDPVGPNDQDAFYPFRVNAGYTCSTLQADWQQMTDNLIAQGDLIMDMVLGDVLAATLASLTLSPVYSSAKPSLRALAAVDSVLNDTLAGGNGRIWTSEEVLAEAYGYVANEGPTKISTLSGVPIGVASSFDVAYQGGSDTEDVGFVWGTGPVAYKTTPWAVIGETWQNYDYQRNVGRAEVQAFGVIAFDVSLVVATSACLSTCS